MLLKSAEELKQFSKGEEDLLESQLTAITELGINVIVSGLQLCLDCVIVKMFHECAYVICSHICALRLRKKHYYTISTELHN